MVARSRVAEFRLRTLGAMSAPASDLVLAMTGASGSVYGLRLLHVLLSRGQTVHLTISPAAAMVLEHEQHVRIDLEAFDADRLLDAACAAIKRFGGKDVETSIAGRLVYHHYQDYRAGLASGSFPTAGMVICPCSLGTLANIAQGTSSHLIHRAAEVHLKERRKLILVPRETPLSGIQLENLRRLADAGAVILPAMPGFYHDPHTVLDLVDFVVARICDQLGVEHNLIRRWGSDT